MSSDVLYSIRNLDVEYDTRLGGVRAVDDFSLDIQKGEILGLVGESGCGKSTLGKGMMRTITTPGHIVGGELWFEGVDLMTLSEKQMSGIRGNKIGMVFQDPMTSLNPLMTIVDHLTEAIRAHHKEVSQQAARARATEMVAELGIRTERIDDYPHQFSGGMRQRIMIALVLALNASLVIADEPTTALDVIVEAQFLDLLRGLRKEFELTILLITHNIGVVAELADRVAVMYAGKLAEVAPVDSLFLETKHPYSRGLLKSVPNIDVDNQELYKMEGAPPNLIAPPSGCRFHPRCPYAVALCAAEEPELTTVSGEQHRATCWIYSDRKDRPTDGLT
ncbi:MAG: ABC transporter ATP-binding protein [Acidimicrobiia bacterium]|nr:MAG: ABC transporter ATP-binding protein [Acidimicrobiia bacterium]